MLRRLGIEPGEGGIFAWGTAVLVLIGMADAAFRNVAETLFLKRVGVELLPILFLVNGVLLIGTTALVGRSVARGDRLLMLPRVLGLLALLLLPLAWLTRIGVEWSLHGLLLASKQLATISLLIFWSAMGDLLHARQAKRLYAPLLGGLTLGEIGGSFASEPLGEWLTTAGIIPCSSAALLLAAAAALPLRSLRPLRLDRGMTPADPGDMPGPIGPGELWRSSQLFRLLTISTLCAGLLAPMLYYQFSYVADLATAGIDGENRLLAFYARFRGWLSTAVLLLEMFVTTSLYRRLGIPLSALLSPLVYLVGFAGLSLRLSLPMAVFATAGTKLSDAAVFDPAQQVFYSLFPAERRARVTTWLEGPVKRLGGAVGNLFILGAIALGGAGLVGEAALPVAALWCAAGFLLWRRYPALLLEATAERRSRIELRPGEALLDAATVRALAAELRNPDVGRCRLAISILSDAPHAAAVQALAEAARHAPPTTRGLLIEALDQLLEAAVAHRVRAPKAARALAELLETPGALEVREHCDLLQGWARLVSDQDLAASDVLAKALREPHASVRLAALAALHHRGLGDGDLDSALEQAVTSEDADLRRTAREELRALLLGAEPDEAWMHRLEILVGLLLRDEDRAETAEALAEIAGRRGRMIGKAAEALLAWRDDPDPRVRAAILRYCGHAGLRERATWMIAHLGSSPPSLSLAAEEGLRALGADILDVLLVEVGSGMRSKRDAVLRLVRDLSLDRKSLRALYERELDAIRDVLIKLGSLTIGGTHAVVLQRLEEKLVESQGTALRFLAAGHDDDRIAELGDRLARAATHGRHAILLEALEALLPPRERSELIPLLEGPGLEARGRAAARALRMDLPSHESAILALHQDSDELVRLLAKATAPADDFLAESPDLSDPGRMLTPVETMLHLRSLPIFDGLTTRQLMDLALAVSEETHPAGARIVREGEVSDGLYLIVDGRVQISKDDHPLSELGPKSYFGEVAIFDGAARSATAHAIVSTRVLRLGRDDLLRLMEEFPGIAIGVCQNLSRRVRELSDIVTG